VHQEGHPAWLAPARGLLLAALATLLATTGHVVGGGSLDDLSPFAVLVPMLATVMVAVAERCRGIVAMLAALGAGQAGLHAVLGVLTAHHDHVGGAVLPAPPMVAAHAVATLVVAAVLWHADAAVGALTAVLRRTLPRRVPIAAVDVPLPTRPIPAADVPWRARVALVAAHARRGPPLPC
jgi:hypothetical protein